jgi:hypothetical protein
LVLFQFALEVIRMPKIMIETLTETFTIETGHLNLKIYI